MTCDRCALSLQCLGGRLDPREVEICHRCRRVLLNHGNLVFTCADLDTLNTARRPTSDVRINPPPHYCPQCVASMKHRRWNEDESPTYYFDLDKDDMVQVDYR